MNSEYWPRAIIHVDMDAFFASVEVLDNPELKGKPVIVGSPPEERGVVAAASYEARKFGIHSAMPMANAVQRCPHGVFLRGRGWRYGEISKQLREIFLRFTPKVEAVSIDEAFLDITGSQRLFGTPREIGQKIKQIVLHETGLTASVGIAPNKFVAKIASDLEKPDGLVIIPAGEVFDRLGPLSIERIWGVGKKTAKSLHQLGIRTIAQLRCWPREELIRRFGATGEHLASLCQGEDSRAVEQRAAAKSISHEITFHIDIMEIEKLKETIIILADKVAARMRAAGVVGRVAFLKVRYSDLSIITRRGSLPEPSSLAETISQVAITMLIEKTEAGKRPIRLVGVGMADLTDENKEVQSSLFGKAQRQRAEAVERAADRIRNKIGKGAIMRGLQVPHPESKENKTNKGYQQLSD
ncbi:MAG: DNA polymerase IV [Planctomycetes bacterium]|nr:DNA polymerase IV [Planctomycetota bacterium]